MPCSVILTLHYNIPRDFRFRGCYFLLIVSAIAKKIEDPNKIEPIL
jgi:hypothetical protein